MIEFNLEPWMLWTAGWTVYGLIGIMVGRKVAMKWGWDRDEVKRYFDPPEATGAFLAIVCIMALWPGFLICMNFGRLVFPKKSTKE